MYTSSPNLDTHQIMKTFKVAGIKPDHAEAIVNAISSKNDSDLSRLATKEQVGVIKEQVELLKQQIEFVRQQLDQRIANVEKSMATTMATKEDLANLEKAMAKQETNSLKWMIGTMLALASVVFAIVKFVH